MRPRAHRKKWHDDDRPRINHGRLRLLMKLRGWSERELARRAGVRHLTVNATVHGRNRTQRVRRQTLQRYAAALEVPEEWLSAPGRGLGDLESRPPKWLRGSWLKRVSEMVEEHPEWERSLLAFLPPPSAAQENVGEAIACTLERTVTWWQGLSEAERRAAWHDPVNGWNATVIGLVGESAATAPRARGGVSGPANRAPRRGRPKIVPGAAIRVQPPRASPRGRL